MFTFTGTSSNCCTTGLLFYLFYCQIFFKKTCSTFFFISGQRPLVLYLEYLQSFRVHQSKYILSDWHLLCHLCCSFCCPLCCHLLCPFASSTSVFCNTSLLYCQYLLIANPGQHQSANASLALLVLTLPTYA